MTMSWRDRLRPARRRPMSCAQVASLLQQYLDGELSGPRVGRLAIHLEDCRRCGLEADAYERIKHALGSSVDPVPQEMVDRLREFGMRLARGEGMISS